MIPDNFKALIAKLVTKTHKKQVVWTKTSRDEEFKLNLEKGAITVDNWYDDEANVWRVDIAIYNDRGDRIDRIAYMEAEKNDYEALMVLHSAAKSAYFKVEDTFKDIFKELDSDKTIGSEQSTDDLPF
jgi:hypothetical protein